MRTIIALAIVLMLAACSSGGAGEPPASTGSAPAPTGAGVTTPTLISSRVNRGSATLTIGDQVWAFDNFLCAFGHVATESEIYSFSTLGTGQFDGVSLRLQVDIEDPSGEGRVEGPNVRQDVTLDDGQTNSDVRWSAVEGPELVRIDGYSVTASGAFIDHTIDTLRPTEVPGTLEATCGDGSRFSP